MQPQEDLLANNNNTFPFSSKLKDDLQKAAQWAKISAILTLCGVVVVLLQAMLQHNLLGTLIMEGINIALTICLLYFGIYTKRGIDNIDQPAFEKGLNNLKLYFKTLGIIIIIVVSLFTLVFTVALLFGKAGGLFN